MKTALYRFFDADDRLLYIGITHRLPDRFSDHKKKKPWNEVARITVEHYDSRAEALEAEKKAIEVEGPKWNVMHNGSRPEIGPVSDPTASGDALVGRWFHSFNEREDGCRTTRWQGTVLAQVALGVYLVETYEWLGGEPYDQTLVHLEEMMGWVFYDTDEWMRWNYNTYLKHRSERHTEGICGKWREVS